MRVAEQLGYPVVLKVLDASLTHKSDVGAVALNLENGTQVASAVTEIQQTVVINGEPIQHFLVESMVDNAIAELIVGIKRDQQFGLALVIGAGGVLVELLSDSVSLLLPTDRSSVANAIESLSVAKID